MWGQHSVFPESVANIVKNHFIINSSVEGIFGVKGQTCDARSALKLGDEKFKVDKTERKCLNIFLALAEDIRKTNSLYSSNEIMLESSQYCKYYTYRS